MPRIMSVEKSKFINENIKIYEKIKVGQYSKFLDKNPIFLTYYHINKNMTRNDVGTGGIEHEVGNRSPIRFNKILDFPVYNIPDLKPDINYDESGYDIELDLSDLLILPNTIKPTPGDYMLLELYNVPKILFRVNNISYNTVQSNDFYNVSCDIKYVGEDVDKLHIDDVQVVEIYQTVFDNIGTNDKCFILNKDIENVNVLVHTFYNLRDRYYNDFYDSTTNSFLLQLDEIDKFGNMISEYDPYLEAFINKSRIFYDENKNSTLVLTPNDLLDRKFNSIFDKSLYYALLNRTIIQMMPYHYYYISNVQKKNSVFIRNNIPVKTVNLLLFPNCLANENEEPELDEQWGRINEDGWMNTWEDLKNSSYYDIPFLEAVKYTTDLDTENYYQKIIIEFLSNKKVDINRQKLYDEYNKSENITYRYIPLILFILTMVYNEYFHNDKNMNL